MMEIKFLLFVLLLILASSNAAQRRLHRRPTSDVREEPIEAVSNGGFNCASMPPALWCACPESQEKCGTKQLCAQYANAVRNQPLHITLLYESLCPDCQQFLPKLFDVYQRFKQYVRVELVPFGNAQINKNGTIECQHGEEECRINKYESCAINYMHEPLPFIKCLEALIANGQSLERASKKCYAQIHPLPHIWDQITHCFNGPKGDQLQKMDAQKTAAAWPDKHEFVPWILVNNASFKSQQFLQNDLPTLICQSYVGDSEIGQCEAFQQTASQRVVEED